MSTLQYKLIHAMSLLIKFLQFTNYERFQARLLTEHYDRDKVIFNPGTKSKITNHNRDGIKYGKTKLSGHG
jgi:hypothetical protein